MLQLRPWALQHAESAITLGCLYESPGMPCWSKSKNAGGQGMSQPGGEQSFPDLKGDLRSPLRPSLLRGGEGDLYVWACSPVPMFLL